MEHKQSDEHGRHVQRNNKVQPGHLAAEHKPCDDYERHVRRSRKVQLGKSFDKSILRHLTYLFEGSTGEHCDYGYTIQFEDTSSDNLQFEIEWPHGSGKWISVPVPPGCCLIFAGDMLERAIAGVILAVKHRVVTSNSSS